MKTIVAKKILLMTLVGMLLSIPVTMLASVCTSVNVYAEEETKKVNKSQTKTRVKSGQDSAYYSNLGGIELDPNGDNAMYDSKDYFRVKSTDNVEYAFDTATFSHTGDNADDIIKQLDQKADVGGAANLTSGLRGGLALVLGILVVIITIGMTLLSAIDIIYITFPAFRNNIEESKQSGQNSMFVQQGSSRTGGEAKVRWISDDAQAAIQQTSSGENGGNPYIVYFSKRLVSYVVLAVLLFILMTGKITVFTSLGVQIASGIIDLIGQI